MGFHPRGNAWSWVVVSGERDVKMMRCVVCKSVYAEFK